MCILKLLEFQQGRFSGGARLQTCSVRSVRCEEEHEPAHCSTICGTYLEDPGKHPCKQSLLHTVDLL